VTATYRLNVFIGALFPVASLASFSCFFVFMALGFSFAKSENTRNQFLSAMGCLPHMSRAFGVPA
jgi:hypothetical protein